MSRRLSPFESDDDPAENVSVSADSRRAADSNESLVLVESSKNTEATVEQVGTSYKGLTQKELGEKMRKANYGHAKATVSENLKKLVENNYIYVQEQQKPKFYYFCYL